MNLKKNLMEFKLFNEAIQKQFNLIVLDRILFRSQRTGREIWAKYLESFENDPVFRDPQSTSHTCNNCNNFIKRYGNIIAIDDNGDVMSIFDNINTGTTYDKVALKVSKFIKSVNIQNVFFETFLELKHLPYERNIKQSQAIFRLGISKDYKQYTKAEADLYGVVKEGEIRTFHHFHIDIPKRFVNMSGDSIEKIAGKYRDKYSVFKRMMEEIPTDTLQLVMDLINQNSLLDGTSHLHVIKDIIAIKKLYKASNMDLSIFCWVSTYYMNEHTAKFKNNLIGVLCTELAEGMELNKACLNWNKRVDPANYHKASAPITKKQIEEAKKFVTDNGYTASFNRRLATIDDIKASEIKHLNSGDGTIKEVSIFDNVKSTSTRHKRSEFKNVEEVTIERFITDILPTCTSIEIFLTNTHEQNFVTLTTSVEKESKPIFKWDNNYSWTFNGNLAGKSYIKEAVKATGGRVDGVLRFSLMWAEGDPTDDSDLDAHCYSPEGHIYFGHAALPSKTPSGGNLDLDITSPGRQRNWKNVAENITWPNLSKMKDGTYKMVANNFSDRGNKYFEAEIEFAGEIYNYRRPNKLPNGQSVEVATVTLKNGEFSIKHAMQETQSSKEIWGLTTNEFHKVNLVCLSPNHWGDNAIGNKHYMFMLNKCINNNDVRGFHNENLLSDLLEHRKVMEVLGASSMIPQNNTQLSGLGFNSTVKDEVIVKCSGSFRRLLKIKF